MFSKLLMVSVGAVGLAFAGATAAQGMTLADLTGAGHSGASITVGNIVYSNFSYGGTTPASSVLITSSTSGLSFAASNWTTPNGGSVIAYDINISGNTLQGVGLDFTATATGNATASVGETVTDKNTSKKYPLQVFVSGAGTSNQTSDSVTLNPTSNSLHVVKSIDVASSGNGTATITLVDNTFVPSNGSPPPVPEPMSLALLPLALAGLGLRKKLAR